MAGIHVRFEVPPEKFLADLTEAAYRVALQHGLKVPFITMELDLHKALYEVIGRDMMASPACGSEVCRMAERFGPWSDEAERLFKA